MAKTLELIRGLTIAFQKECDGESWTDYEKVLVGVARDQSINIRRTIYNKLIRYYYPKGNFTLWLEDVLQIKPTRQLGIFEQLKQEK